MLSVCFPPWSQSPPRRQMVAWSYQCLYFPHHKSQVCPNPETSKRKTSPTMFAPDLKHALIKYWPEWTLVRSFPGFPENPQESFFFFFCSSSSLKSKTPISFHFPSGPIRGKPTSGRISCPLASCPRVTRHIRCRWVKFVYGSKCVWLGISQELQLPTF